MSVDVNDIDEESYREKSEVVIKNIIGSMQERKKEEDDLENGPYFKEKLIKEEQKSQNLDYYKMRKNQKIDIQYPDNPFSEIKKDERPQVL